MKLIATNYYLSFPCKTLFAATKPNDKLNYFALFYKIIYSDVCPLNEEKMSEYFSDGTSQRNHILRKGICLIEALSTNEGPSSLMRWSKMSSVTRQFD